VYKDIRECKYNAKLLRFIDLKELHLILLLSAIFFCFFQTSNSGNYIFYAQGQTPPQSTVSQAQQTSPSFQPAVSVKITSPTNNQNVSTGQLTISGTSTDTTLSECQVYADWNDKKPFQRVVATGSEGNGDYSRWNYTYTATYHEITNGTNELTSKISCLASPTNLTKWYSINVTGVGGLSSRTTYPSESASQEQGNSSNNLNNISSPLSTISATEITPPEDGSSRDLEGSERRSDNDNKDDVEREEENEEKEEKSGEGDFEFIEDQNNDEANNGNAELFSINENNLEEDEEDSTSEDDLEDSDQNENESQDPLYEDNDSIDSNLEVIRDRNNSEDEDRSGEEDSTSEDDLEDSDQNENESQDPLYEDNDSIDSNLEVIRDRNNSEDEDRSGEDDSEIDSFIDIPFEVLIPTIPSIPSLPTPDLDDLVEIDSDDDNCEIDDAGFPFCDGQQLEEESSTVEDNCDIDDAGFPFCDGRED
jgi:Bacterial Ig domain